MTTHSNTDSTESSGPGSEVVGLLAEFDTQHQLLDACNQCREAGYKSTDAHTPFPVHGIDPALGIRRTRLPFIVLAIGMSGTAFAVFLQWYTNSQANSPVWPGYDYIIGGKPMWSLPANIPVVFEVTVLLSAFAAFFGMWGLNKLPMFANPLLRMERFRRATSDKFFLVINADDKNYDADQTRQQMESWGATAVEPIEQDLTDGEMPKWLKPAVVCAACFLLIPPAMIWRARGQTSQQPRLHAVPDMDWQYKSKAQQVSPGLEGFPGQTLFADNRVMRAPIDGTVARGELPGTSPYYRGIQDGGDDVATRFVSTALQEADPPAPQDPAPQDQADATNEPNWVTSFPAEVDISMETINRGRQRYNIYCSACHGYAGEGDGLISRRAVDLAAQGKSAWAQTKNLRELDVKSQPVGRIYDTITNGRNTMGGYASQISVEDRWAIVLYVRALQRSEYRELTEVPEGLRDDIPSEPTVKIGFDE